MTKTLKKTLAIVVALALCLSAFMGCFSVSAVDANGVSIATVIDGDTAIVDFTLEAVADDAFTVALFDIEFDEALNIVGIPVDGIDPATELPYPDEPAIEISTDSGVELAEISHNSITNGVADVSVANAAKAIRVIVETKEIAKIADATVTITFDIDGLEAGDYAVNVTNAQAATAGTYDGVNWGNDEALIKFGEATTTTAASAITVAPAHTCDMETKYDEAGHWTECTCGEKTEVVAHTMGDWADGARACTAECGYTETCEHTSTKLSYNVDGHYTVCDICGIVGETTAHTMGDWADGTRACTAECGYSENCEHTTTTLKYTDATGHWAECDTCGHKAETVAHTMGDWADGTRACTAQCGYTETCEHANAEYELITVTTTTFEYTSTCPDCNKSLTKSTSIGAAYTGTAVCPRTLVPENDISIEYHLRKSSVPGYTDIVLVASKEVFEKGVAQSNYEQVIITDWETSNKTGSDAYFFLFSDIAGYEMNNNIIVSFYGMKDGEMHLLLNMGDYSVNTFLQNRFNNAGSTDVQKDVYVDMVIYGAAAQVLAGVNVANPADFWVTDEILEDYGTTVYPETSNDFTKVALNDKTNTDVRETYGTLSANRTLVLESKVNIIVALNTANLAKSVDLNDLYCKFEYIDTNNTEQSHTIKYDNYTYSGLPSFKFDKSPVSTIDYPVSITIYHGDPESDSAVWLHSFDYSIETFLANRISNPNSTSEQIAVYKTIYAYGRSVAALANISPYVPAE